MSTSQSILPQVSAKFANMSIVCAFLVVCMHVGGTFEKGTAGWWLTEFTRGGLSRIAVPYFFLAAGFFLAGHIDEQGWWRREVGKRVRTLLIPLVIWCLIGSVWGAFWMACANHMAGRPLGYDIPFCNGEWMPRIGVLWFVRNLFMLVLVAPLVKLAIQRMGFLWVGACFGIYWTIFTCLDPVKPVQAWEEFLVYWFSLEGLAYFSLGMFLRMTKVDLLAYSWRSCVVSMIIGGGALLFSLCFNLNVGEMDWSPLMSFRHFCLPFLMVVFWMVMPKMPLASWLVGTAFPVYILHGHVNIPVSIIFKRISVLGTAGYICRWGLTFCICVAVAHALHRFMPRTAKILFGGR